MMRHLAPLLLVLFLCAPVSLAAPPPDTDAAAIVQALRRFTYGPRIGDLERVRKMGLHRWFEQQLDPAFLADADAERRVRPFVGRTDAASLAREKVMRAVYSERQLQELMVDFWFNHFNVDARKVSPALAAYERGIIRRYALGNFTELLRAVAHSPAMLEYLDNNRSSGPESPAGRAALRAGKAPPNLNENYARELLELHTLGVDGGYSQRDVVEVARILTGWTVAAGAFKFDGSRHEDGDKIVLGTRFPYAGQDEGERLITFLATHPTTAEHIAWKLCRRFVSDDPPRTIVYRVASIFRGSGGDIRTAMREVFTSAEFYGAHYSKTKSPLEAVVSSVRAVRAEVSDAETLTREVERLGEPLYRCAPPTGYGDVAATWINSGTFVARLDFAQQLCHNQLRGVRCTPPKAAPNTLIGDILGRDASAATRKAILSAAAAGASAEDILSLIVGAPEFQTR